MLRLRGLSTRDARCKMPALAKLRKFDFIGLHFCAILVRPRGVFLRLCSFIPAASQVQLPQTFGRYIVAGRNVLTSGKRALAH
jgi:hypothetical protein